MNEEVRHFSLRKLSVGLASVLYLFVLTFKDGQYRLTTFDTQGKLLKTYSIKSYKKLAKIIHSLVSMNIA